MWSRYDRHFELCTSGERFLRVGLGNKGYMRLRKLSLLHYWPLMTMLQQHWVAALSEGNDIIEHCGSTSLRGTKESAPASSVMDHYPKIIIYTDGTRYTVLLSLYWSKFRRQWHNRPFMYTSSSALNDNTRWMFPEAKLQTVSLFGCNWKLCLCH